MPSGSLDARKLEFEVLAALAGDGVTASQVAHQFGVSRRTICRIQARARKRTSEGPSVPVDIVNAEPRGRLDPGALASAAMSLAIGEWFEQVDDAIGDGIGFLRAACKKLDPSKAGDVKVVSDCVVKLLTDVERLKRGINNGTNAGGTAAPPAGLRSAVDAMSDAELVSEAKAIFEKEKHHANTTEPSDSPAGLPTAVGS